MSDYTLSNTWPRARQQLTSFEQAFDRASIACLEQLGVAPGWRCLEVGGGGGSIASWLCHRVTRAGQVVAVDLDPRFLRALEHPNLDVRELDIVTDELPVGDCDLVHCRMVLTHLSQRGRVLAKIAAAVKPGGWILLEEADFTTYGPDGSNTSAVRELHDRVWRARLEYLRPKIDFRFGASLWGRLGSLGFESIRADGYTPLFRGGAPASVYERIIAEQHASGTVALGQVTREEYGAYLALWDDPAFVFRAFLLVSAWGKRPA